jgi:hypothetical protein
MAIMIRDVELGRGRTYGLAYAFSGTHWSSTDEE